MLAELWGFFLSKEPAVQSAENKGVWLTVRVCQLFRVADSSLETESWHPLAQLTQVQILACFRENNLQWFAFRQFQILQDEPWYWKPSTVAGNNSRNVSIHVASSVRLLLRGSFTDSLRVPLIRPSNRSTNFSRFRLFRIAPGLCKRIRSVGRSVDRSVGRSVGRLVGQLVSHSADLVCFRPTQTNCSTDPMDRSIDQLYEIRTDLYPTRPMNRNGSDQNKPASPTGWPRKRLISHLFSYRSPKKWE